MARNRKDIIRRQELEISFVGKTDPFAFRDLLSSVCTDKLLPAMEELFNERSPKDKILRFDKLTIDIGELPHEHWEGVFVEKVLDQLSEYLSDTSSSVTYHNSSSRATNETAKLEIEVHEGELSSVLYFLQTGHLPWNSSIKSKEELRQALVSVIQTPLSLEKLLNLISNNTTAADRLVLQFDDVTLDRLLALSGALTITLIAAIKEFSSEVVRLTNTLKRSERDLVYTHLLNAASSQGLFLKGLITSLFSKGVFEKWFEGLVASGTDIERAHLNDVLKFVREKDLSNTTGVSGTAFVPDNLKLMLSKVIKLDILQQEVFDFVISPNPSNAYTRKVDQRTADLTEELFISNAGLILLHPFLPLLFENIGYTEKKQWVDDEHIYRAIALTQYMVTGMEEYPEFDLVLNKILLGYPVERTFPGNVLLSDFEKQEANDVLYSVIKHWSALKNTSLEGLQKTFLQRDGKLWKTDNAWQLVVDQKTVDILMNRLPWGISTIKTPWMKGLMHVEWV